MKVILMGEQHTLLFDGENYNQVIKTQKAIINDAIQKHGKSETVLYSEIPDNDKKYNVTIHACEITKYAEEVIRVEFSSVDINKRLENGFCDKFYAEDIINILEDKNINCVVVAIGLAHINMLYLYLRIWANKEEQNLEVEIYNTCTQNQVDKFDEDFLKCRSISDLLSRYPPYKIKKLDVKDVPIQDRFIPIILHNKSGDKVFQCPKCQSISGTLAPKDPMDLEVFSHYHDCLNAMKYPIESKV